MSTKIYYAYRFRPYFLSEFMNIIQDYRKEFFHLVYADVVDWMDEQDWEKGRGLRKWLKEEWPKLKNLASIANDVTCALWIYDDYVYVKFFGNYGDLGRLDKRLTLSNHIHDFHYQNQTDIPDDIPEAQYDERIKIWDKIFTDIGTPDKFTGALQIEIIPDFISQEILPIWMKIGMHWEKAQEHDMYKNNKYTV